MINKIFYDDILAQPEAIESLLPDLRSQLKPMKLKQSGFQRIILAGSGDSYFGPLSLQYLFQKYCQVPIFPICAMNAASYWHFRGDDLFIAISFSGKAARTIKAVEEAKKNSAKVLAITGDDQSPLAELSDYVLKINWHSSSRNIPHTVDYLTTLLSIACIIETMNGKRIEILDELSRLVIKTIQMNLKSSIDLGDSLSQNDSFMFLGTGSNFGSAQYGSAKFWEACGINAFPFEMEEFAHGPHKLIEEGEPIVLLAPDEASIDLGSIMVKGINELGARPIVVTNNSEKFNLSTVMSIPNIAKEWSPFIVTIPLQLLAWSVATAKGYDVVQGVGRIKNIEKVREVQKTWIR